MQASTSNRHKRGNKPAKLTAAELTRSAFGLPLTDPTPNSSIQSKTIQLADIPGLNQNVTVSINGLQVMTASADQRIMICSAQAFQDDEASEGNRPNTVTVSVPPNMPINITSPKQTVLQLKPIELEEDDNNDVSQAVEDSVTARNKTHVVNLTVRIKPTGEVTTLQAPLSIE